jgi:toxin ParE1/3/4
MKVRFEPAARDELDNIFDWISKHNPQAALDLITRIEEKVMRLETPELANMGRPGLVQRTRELLEYPYIVVYRVDKTRDQVVVVSVVHGAQDREEGG